MNQLSTQQTDSILTSEPPGRVGRKRPLLRVGRGPSLTIKRVFIGLAAIVIAPLNLAAATITNQLQLREALSVVLNNSHAPGATWGVEVVALTNGTSVFSLNPRRLFVPASCTKLFTAALVLDRLGADFRISTRLQTTGQVTEEGKLLGDLVWVGRGAPDLGERQSGSLAAALKPYIEAVLRAGIQQVEGSIVADESFFQTQPFGPGWNWDDLSEGYGAAVSALTLNDNTVRVQAQPGEAGLPVSLSVEPFPSAFTLLNRTRTTGPETQPRLRFERLPGQRELWVYGTMPLGTSAFEEKLAVPEPARTAAEALQRALEQRGVRIRQACRVTRWQDRPNLTITQTPSQPNPVAASRTRILATVESAPLGELVRVCLKSSQNLHAQLLWLQVGAALAGQAHPKEPPELELPTTDEMAQRALEQFLGKLTLTGNDYALEEGSGLSRKNLVTPAATVALLRQMDRHPIASIREAWLAALPIGGIDGTLKSRFSKPPVRGNVHAKTGSLRQVHALAGYVTTAANDRVAFAIYVNGFASTNSPNSGRETVDRFVDVLAAYRGPL